MLYSLSRFCSKLLGLNSTHIGPFSGQQPFQSRRKGVSILLCKGMLFGPHVENFPLVGIHRHPRFFLL